MSNPTQNYAFIDANYLRRAYEDSMRRLLADASWVNIDFVSIKRSLNASKVFYYDAVDEDAADVTERVTRLDAIAALDGFHVRQGTISPKKTQKQVDVQLAVDALLHAFNKNIWHASLIAGDLYFKPLVDALINLGVHVHVFYDPHSAAKRLHRVADIGVPVTLKTFWDWSAVEYQEIHTVPRITRNENDNHPGGIHMVMRS